jgi:hypothetical protein
MPARRFPPPWSVDDPDIKLGQTCFIVRDADGHALAYVYDRQRTCLPVTRSGASPPTSLSCRSC